MAKNTHVPKHVKALRGTLRKDRDEKGMDLPAIDFLPDPPNDYTVSQKKIWIDIVKSLYAAKSLNEVGLPLIHSYCVQCGNFERAAAEIKAKGIVIIQETKKGNIIKQNPAVQVLNSSNQLMIAISKEFGFSLLAQSKIKSTPIDPSKNKKASKFDI